MIKIHNKISLSFPREFGLIFYNFFKFFIDVCIYYAIPVNQ